MPSVPHFLRLQPCQALIQRLSQLTKEFDRIQIDVHTGVLLQQYVHSEQDRHDLIIAANTCPLHISCHTVDPFAVILKRDNRFCAVALQEAGLPLLEDAASGQPRNLSDRKSTAADDRDPIGDLDSVDAADKRINAINNPVDRSLKRSLDTLPDTGEYLLYAFPRAFP